SSDTGTGMTPEAKVKARAKKVLNAHGAYHFWPVQTGMGSRTLDCLGCIRGAFFAIETKAPGKKPTKLQEHTIEQMQLAKAKVVVIDGDTSELEKWLATVRDLKVVHDPCDSEHAEQSNSGAGSAGRRVTFSEWHDCEPGARTSSRRAPSADRDVHA